MFLGRLAQHLAYRGAHIGRFKLQVRGPNHVGYVFGNRPVLVFAFTERLLRFHPLGHVLHGAMAPDIGAVLKHGGKPEFKVPHLPVRPHDAESQSQFFIPAHRLAPLPFKRIPVVRMNEWQKLLQGLKALQLIDPKNLFAFLRPFNGAVRPVPFKTSDMRESLRFKQSALALLAAFVFYLQFL
ncbi:hypothetical protein SDC9_176491 [bioreactor metagenome]|uniref:Uncharacterized protein n=1 Tax=bioreactor metagenome TaxID=1076179 RepID=A0A645GZJ3_9ZZZZ